MGWLVYTVTLFYERSFVLSLESLSFSFYKYLILYSCLRIYTSRLLPAPTGIIPLSSLRLSYRFSALSLAI